MTNREIRTHIHLKEYQKEQYQIVMRRLRDLNLESPFRDATFKELEARVSSAIAQCDISIRDHQKLITTIKCHCKDEDERYECYAECDYKAP